METNEKLERAKKNLAKKKEIAKRATFEVKNKEQESSEQKQGETITITIDGTRLHTYFAYIDFVKNLTPEEKARIVGNAQNDKRVDNHYCYSKDIENILLAEHFTKAKLTKDEFVQECIMLRGYWGLKELYDDTMFELVNFLRRRREKQPKVVKAVKKVISRER